MKFDAVNMDKTPLFVPLKSILKADLIEDSSSWHSNGHVFKIEYEDLELSGQTTEMLLTSDTANSVIEWSEMVKRLHQLYEMSKATTPKVEKNGGVGGLIDNSERNSMVSPIKAVRETVSPNKHLQIGQSSANRQLIFNPCEKNLGRPAATIKNHR